MKTMLLILIALLASCPALTAQNAKQGDSSASKAGDQQGQRPPQKAAEKHDSTPQLQDATPASAPRSSSGPSLLKETGSSSVEDAARKAAYDLAATAQSGSSTKSGDVTKDAQAAKKDASGSPTTSEVGEFHAVPEGTSRSSANPIVQKDSSPGKRVHGELYGGGGPTGRAGSESVGATSKSGKTSVYVQSDQARSSATPP